MVNDDTDTSGLFPPDTSFFEFRESEATALTQLAVVAEGLAANCRAQMAKGADSKAGRFCFACSASAELAPGLVEPGADAALPVLMEVIDGED